MSECACGRTDCPACAASAAERLGGWDGKRGGRASLPTLPCRFVGEARLVEGSVSSWTGCGHPAKPLGDPVCPCRGCGPGCAGYEAAGLVIDAGDAYEFPAPASARIVCTVAVGETGAATLAATGDLMRRYAARIGADFYAIEGDALNPHYPVGDKFRLHHLTGRYERLCFIDADALVHPDAPDVFDAVPAGTVGFRDDAADSGDMRPYIDAVCKSQGVDPANRDVVLNSGVVVWDGGMPVWSPPPKPLPPGCHVAEQCWVQQTVGAARLPVTRLSRRWNHQWWADRDFALARRTPPYVLHPGMSYSDAVPGWKMSPAQARAAALAAAAWVSTPLPKE